MGNTITYFEVRTSDVDPKLTVSEHRGEVLIVIQHMIGSAKSGSCAIFEIKEDLRKAVLSAAARAETEFDNESLKCGTVSIDYDVEDPELTVRIWNPVKFNSNFNENFEKLITTAIDLLCNC